MVLTTALRNLKDTGKVLRTSIFSLFVNTPLELGAAELAMALSVVFCLPLQKAVMRGTVSWGTWGSYLQHVLQAIWLAIWVYTPFFLKWQWFVHFPR